MFNSHSDDPELDGLIPKPTTLPPNWRVTPLPSAAVQPPAEPVIEITELVVSNRLFVELAHALRLSDDEARAYLHDAMHEADTHPGALTAEDLWFLLPRIESDVLAHFVDQDASIRREQLNELLRRIRYESLNGMKRRKSGSYARLA